MVKNRVVTKIQSILIIALAVRILLFSGILLNNPDGFFTRDSYDYNQIADNIVHHASFSQNSSPPLLPDHSRTTLYPIYISLFKWVGLGPSSMIFFQILLSVATTLFVILITYKLVDNWNSALFAGGIIALDFPSIALSNVLLTEAIFTFLLTLSIFCLVLYFKNDSKFQLLFSFSALLGLTILYRPISVFLPIFIIPLFFVFLGFKKLKILHSLSIVILTSFLVISPWMYRNQVVFGSPVISTIGYNNLLYYRAAGVISIKESISRPNVVEKLKEKTRAEFNGDIEKDSIGLKKYEARMGSSIILHNLPLYIRNHVISVFNMLFRPIRSTFDLQLGFVESGTSLTEWGEEYESSIFSRFFKQTSPLTVFLVVIQLPLLLILWVGFIYGMIYFFVKKKTLPFSLLLILVLYFCIMSGGPEAWARFRVPIVPFLSIGCGIGLATIFEQIKGKSIEKNKGTEDTNGFNPSYIWKRNDVLDLVPANVKNILDVGCSNGTLGGQIKDKFPASEVCGIELNKEMAERALEKIDRVIVGNIERQDLAKLFNSNYFDCIIFADLLEHLQDPWRVLKDMTKYLKADGTIIASMPNVRHYSSIFNLLFKGYWPYRDRGIHDRTHLRFFTKKNIIELFQSAELQIINIIPHYRIIEKPYKINRISRFFAIPPFREFLAFQYLIVAKVRNTKA